MDFKTIIKNWYFANRRELPWRNTKNPYFIWVSEIILQQTRVAQGVGYYQRFISTFPTVFDLASADIDQVLKVWQGLGYYTRARNMHSAAKLIVELYNGEIPSTYDELIKIKGVGHYSAGAIASFAFGQVAPAIDGNVYRIIARIFGVFTQPNSSQGKKEFRQIVMDLMDKKHPEIFNQALLDFGALQCVPRSPNCVDCPFNKYCYAYRNNLVDSLPTKGKRIIPHDRFFTYLLVKFKGMTFIAKRKANDIWHSLYEFPLIETDVALDPKEISVTKEWSRYFGKTGTYITYISPVVKHQLSHQTLYTRFIIVQVAQIPSFLKRNFTMISTADMDNYSVPRLIESFLAAEPTAKYFTEKNKGE